MMLGKPVMTVNSSFILIYSSSVISVSSVVPIQRI